MSDEDKTPSERRVVNATCGTCRFYSSLASQCRKRPPTLFLVANAANGASKFVSLWPQIPGGEWCGEFAPQSPPHGA